LNDLAIARHQDGILETPYGRQDDFLESRIAGKSLDIGDALLAQIAAYLAGIEADGRSENRDAWIHDAVSLPRRSVNESTRKTSPSAETGRA
jgi:hypothetical protein